MAKISKTHHMTKNGKVKKNPKKKTGMYRVYDIEPGNISDRKTAIKNYRSFSKAAEDYNSRVADMQEQLKIWKQGGVEPEWQEYSSTNIENLKTGVISTAIMTEDNIDMRGASIERVR